MRSLLLAAVMLWPTFGFGKVLNVEFNFAAYTGDLKAETVNLMPGTVHIFMNNVPFADQDVSAQAVPVMFDDREIASSVWVPTESMKAELRKGKNTIRFEFEPNDPKAPYRTQLRWASVTDKVKNSDSANTHQSTNQAGQGSEDKEATGKFVVEHTFDASEFATDQPWHHYPAVTAVTDADRQQLAATLKEVADGFKPDFAPIYKALARDPKLRIGEIKKMKCLEAAYDAGLRVQPPPIDDLQFTFTGGPEVVVTRKGGRAGLLFDLPSEPFAKIKDDEVQMCAGIATMRAFPPRLVVVRDKNGKWSTPY